MIDSKLVKVLTQYRAKIAIEVIDEIIKAQKEIGGDNGAFLGLLEVEAKYRQQLMAQLVTSTGGVQ